MDKRARVVMLPTNEKAPHKYHSEFPEELPNCVFEEIIKVNPKDNTITIKRVKNTFTRDEVIGYSYWLRTTDFNVEGYSPEDCFNKWIEDNLDI